MSRIPTDYGIPTINPEEPNGIATLTKLRSKQWQNGTFDPRWRGAELDPDAKARREREVEANPNLYRPWAEWTLEGFQARLTEIVKSKDKNAGAKKAQRTRRDGEDALDSHMHASFLLIFTPELHLQQHRLAEYLEQTEVRRPGNFDRVFVMGYAPRDDNPVFEVRLIDIQSRSSVNEHGRGRHPGS